MENAFLQELFGEREARARAEGEAAGEARGEARGRLAAARELCLEAVAAGHPELLVAAKPVVASCNDAALLAKWILQVSKATSTAECARLLGLPD